MRTAVEVPVIKNRTGDASDKSNYRRMSLATIIAKVFEKEKNQKTKGGQEDPILIKYDLPSKCGKYTLASSQKCVRAG